MLLSGHEEDYFFELRNLELKFFSRISWLNKGTRHSETDQNKNKMVCIIPSRSVMNSGNFRNNFLSDLATIKFSTSFHCKFFQASKAIKCFRRAKLVHE